LRPRGRGLRALGWSVYLPSALYGVGQGAIAPVVVTTAVDLGASLGAAGLMVALIGVGQIAGDVPTGRLIGRYGEKALMGTAVVLVVPALAACILAPNLWMLAAGVALTGICGSVWNLARQTYVTDVVPFETRARALSTLAGANRIGRFVGPFAGAATFALLGTDGAYWVNILAALAAVAVLMFAPDVREASAPRSEVRRGVLRANLPILRTLGVAVLSFSALRAVRQAVIPIWGIHIGLDATAISLIYGLSAAVDMVLFYPGGKIMDRYGRRWVAVPATAVLALAHMALPLAGGASGLAVVGILMGVGNGISSGIVMTLGADLAPPDSRPAFLGVWRMLADIGNGAGPVGLSALIALVSPAAAVVAVGALGLATAWALVHWIPPNPVAAGRTPEPEPA
jgi:MFS family permease